MPEYENSNDYTFYIVYSESMLVIELHHQLCYLHLSRYLLPIMATVLQDGVIFFAPTPTGGLVLVSMQGKGAI